MNRSREPDAVPPQVELSRESNPFLVLGISQPRNRDRAAARRHELNPLDRFCRLRGRPLGMRWYVLGHETELVEL